MVAHAWVEISTQMGILKASWETWSKVSYFSENLLQAHEQLHQPWGQVLDNLMGVGFTCEHTLKQKLLEFLFFFLSSFF
jgi:hypothetical protein